MATQKFTAKQVADALKISRGTVYLAAEHLRCEPKTVYNYLDRYESVRQAREDASERMLDWGEVKLFERIMAGDIVAIKYLLSTKGKNRGYVQEAVLKHEVEHGIAKVPEPVDAMDVEFWDASVARELEHVRKLTNGSTEGDLGSE